MTEKLLNDSVAKQVRDAFDKQMRQPVQVLSLARKAIVITAPTPANWSRKSSNYLKKSICKFTI